MQENHEVSKGMYLNALSAGSTIDLETKSRHYRIEYLEGDQIGDQIRILQAPAVAVPSCSSWGDSNEFTEGSVGRQMRLSS